MYLVDAEDVFRKPASARLAPRWSTPRVTPVDQQIIPNTCSPTWRPPDFKGPPKRVRRGTAKVEWPSSPYLNREAHVWHNDAKWEKWRRGVKRRWGAANRPTSPIPYEMQANTAYKSSWADPREGKVHNRPGSGDPSKYYYEKRHEEQQHDDVSTAKRKLTAQDWLRRRAWLDRQAPSARIVGRRSYNQLFDGVEGASDKAKRRSKRFDEKEKWRKRHPTPKEEVPPAVFDDLAIRARNGNMAAYNELVKAAYPIAERYAKKRAELAGDLVFVGLYGYRRGEDGLLTYADPGDRSTGIWNAIYAWNEEGGKPFRSFLRTNIWRRITDYRREWRKDEKKIFSLNEQLKDDDDND